jgi:hypothetical protein
MPFTYLESWIHVLFELHFSVTLSENVAQIQRSLDPFQKLVSKKQASFLASQSNARCYVSVEFSAFCSQPRFDLLYYQSSKSSHLCRAQYDWFRWCDQPLLCSSGPILRTEVTFLWGRPIQGSSLVPWLMCYNILFPALAKPVHPT